MNKRWRLPRVLVVLALSITIIVLYQRYFSYDEVIYDTTAARECNGGTPKACVRYTLEGGWSGIFGDCPNNYAIYTNLDAGGINKGGPGEFVELDAWCCPLPCDDILVDEHIYNVTEACPDNYVITSGTSPSCSGHCVVRCTKINTQKYQLGPEEMSYFAVYDRVPGDGQGTAKRIKRSDLPIAIRYASSRASIDDWHSASCVGVPYGSLLVRKSSKRCDGFFYRQLQHLDGTPVKMFPDCKTISDPYDPNAYCIE